MTQIDESVLKDMEQCAPKARRGQKTQRLAHSEFAFWAIEEWWEKLYRNGVVEHCLKELCRVYVSRFVEFEYCANQHRETSRHVGGDEATSEDVVNVESSDLFDEQRKAALSYVEATKWRLNTDDAFRPHLHRQVKAEELVDFCQFHLFSNGPIELDSLSQHSSS